MEIKVDPRDSKHITLVKQPRGLVAAILAILVVGVVFGVLFKNGLAFLPFLALGGAFYIFSGNFFEISVDFKAGEIVRNSHDMLHLTEFQTRLKIADVQKIWLMSHSSDSGRSSTDLVIVLKDQSRKKLCSASYGQERDELQKFGFVLAEQTQKEFTAEPDRK